VGSGEGLRPLRVGEVLDAAIKLYRRNAVDLWKIVACVVVPVLLIRTLIVGVTLPSDSFVHNGLLYTPTGRISVPVGAGIAGAVLSVVAALIASGALAISLVDAYVGEPIDWVASIREAGGRLGSLLWLAILWAVLVVVGLIAFVLPGIWLIVVWSVSVPALMFEHVGGFKALGRSFDLVRNRWWATFAEVLVAIIMVAIVTLVIGFVITEITKGLKIGSIGHARDWLRDHRDHEGSEDRLDRSVARVQLAEQRAQRADQVPLRLGGHRRDLHRPPGAQGGARHRAPGECLEGIGRGRWARNPVRSPDRHRTPGRIYERPAAVAAD
jgi:hypothetical protein